MRLRLEMRDFARKSSIALLFQGWNCYKKENFILRGAFRSMATTVYAVQSLAGKIKGSGFVINRLQIS